MGHEILELINNKETVKILVTIDADGLSHPVVKHSLHSDGEHIIYTEFLESSNTNRNMTRSLWFDTPVSLLLLGADNQSYKIKAQPVRALVSGKKFQKYYEQVQKEFFSADLSTVWFLKPLEITNQSFAVRSEEESINRPYFLHLDRLAKKEEGVL